MPMGTIMSSLARARQRLRHELVEYGRENGLLTRPKQSKVASKHENDLEEDQI